MKKTRIKKSCDTVPLIAYGSVVLTLQTCLYPRFISKLTSKFQRRTGPLAYGDWKAGTTTRH
jgi:hypothetical protein